MIDEAEKNSVNENQNRADSGSGLQKTSESKAEPLCKDCRVGRGYRPFLGYVELCPLHAAAPALYEALKDIARQRLTSEIGPIDGEVCGDFEGALGEEGEGRFRLIEIQEHRDFPRLLSERQNGV